jgi:outer membrane receptor protein involved in Fe transport
MSVELRKAIRTLIALSAAGALSHLAPAVAQEAVAQDEGIEEGDGESVAVSTDGPIEEIVVTARQKRAATDVIQERMDQPVVVDLVSVEQISRVGDSTVASALRRLPGVSLVGDFIYIRGLGERYSSTTVNGALVPSPDLTRNVIPLDIFPASILDSLSIQKGFTVDRPAAFGGGNVDIRTRTIPENLLATIQVGTGWNSDLSDDVLTYRGGGDDRLGTDDGTRALPRELRQAIQAYRGSITPTSIFSTLRAQGGDPAFAQAEQINRTLATSLNREIDIKSESADPDLSIEAGLGNSWVLGESAMWKVGVLGVGDYKNNWRNKTRINRSQQLPDIDNGTTEISTNQVALTGSASAGVDYGDDHSLGFTYIFLRNTDDEAAITQRNNFNFRQDQGAQLRDYRIRYEERELNLLQLTGRHVLGPDTLGDKSAGFLDGLEFNWYYSDAKATTDLPSEITVSAVDAVNPTTGEVLSSSIRSTTSAAEYRFTDLEDNVDSYGYKLNLPFEWADGRLTGGVFGGYDYYQKGRSYLQTQFNLGTTSAAATPILVGTPGTVLTDENILNPANQFLLSLGGIGTESYLAGETIDAAFGGVDLTLDERWRLNAGVRWEDWSLLSVPVNQYEFRTSVGKVPLTVDQLANAGKSDDDLYPSAAITYMRPDFWADEFRLRVGYSQTTARPDIREVTQSTFIDPLTDARVTGNPLLVPSDLKNYDIRAEWFFANRDNLTVSPFYKQIDLPIETVEGAGTDNNLSFTFINAETADVYGVEIEWYKDLAFVDRWLGSWASGFFTAGNVTLSDSELEVGNSAFALTNNKRPLTQQSDTILNIQLGYDAPNERHSTTLSYNSFSERLYYAGRNGAPDAYEQPFSSLDLTYSWYPAENWSLKLRLQNLLDENIEIDQGGVTVLEQDIGMTFKADLRYNF